MFAVFRNRRLVNRHDFDAQSFKAHGEQTAFPGHARGLALGGLEDRILMSATPVSPELLVGKVADGTPQDVAVVDVGTTDIMAISDVKYDDTTKWHASVDASTVETRIESISEFLAVLLTDDETDNLATNDVTIATPHQDRFTAEWMGSEVQSFPIARDCEIDVQVPMEFHTACDHSQGFLPTDCNGISAGFAHHDVLRADSTRSAVTNLSTMCYLASRNGPRPAEHSSSHSRSYRTETRGDLHWATSGWTLQR
jgi:hypothetical protein